MLSYSHLFIIGALAVSFALMITPKGLAFVQRRLVMLVCSGVGLLCLAAAVFVAAALFKDSIPAAQWSDAAFYGAFVSWIGILCAGFFLLAVPAALVMFSRLTGWSA